MQLYLIIIDNDREFISRETSVDNSLITTISQLQKNIENFYRERPPLTEAVFCVLTFLGRKGRVLMQHSVFEQLHRYKLSLSC